MALVFFMMLSATAVQSQAISKEAFLDRWESTENYVMEMLERTPDSILGFRPVDSIFSVRGQMVHIYNHLGFIHSTFLSPGSELENWDLPECATVECLETNLAAAFEKIRNSVLEMDTLELGQTHYFRPADRDLSISELLYLLLDHTKHHTGQLVVYLRLNGIEPPRYTGW